MKLLLAILPALLATPAIAQPIILPLQRQQQAEPPPPPPSPVPVAPPQAEASPMPPTPANGTAGSDDAASGTPSQASPPAR